jgi:hypothetical protein
MLPMRGARGVPAFVNLFSAFESKTPGLNISAVATGATASSHQTANAMIRSMLGSLVSAPAATIQADASTNVKNGRQNPANSNPPVAPALTQTGDTLLRSIIGLQSAPVAAMIQAATPNPVVAQAPNQAASSAPMNNHPPLPPAVTQTGDMLLRSMMELQSAPAVMTQAAIPDSQPPSPAPNPTPQATQRSRQSAAPAIARPELASLADATKAIAPVALMAATPAFVPGSDASPATVLNSMQPAAAATCETEAVAPAVAQATSVDAPAPLAFSAELAPIVQEQAAPLPTKNVETPMVSGENEKVRIIAPEQRASGNGAGRDDRSPERDAHQSEKNEVPVRAMQAAGADDFSRGWTTSLAPLTSENPTEKPAGPAGEPVRIGQSTDAATQMAETNPPAMKSFQSPAVQEIAVRIERPDMAPVDLHVTERAGEIHVAVRTADTELQTSLRQDLSSLSNSLERAGYHSETFVPRAAGLQTSLREERPAQQGFSGRGGSQGESGSGKQKGQREQRGASWLQELEQTK